MIEKRRNRILILLVIFLLSLVTISCFYDGKLFLGNDADLPLNPQFYLVKHLYVWDYQFSMGSFNYRAPQFILPYYAIWAGLSSLGFPLVYVESIWVIFLFTLSGFSMFYLFSSLFKSSRYFAAIIVASISFMFNLYMVNILRFGQTSTVMAYAIMPLCLGLFINGVNSKKYLKYSLLIGLTTLLFSFGLTGPPYIISLFIFPSLSYLLYYFLVNGRKGLRGGIKFSALVLAVVIMANLFWIAPFVISLTAPSNIFPSYGTVNTSYYDFINPVQFYKVIVQNGFYAFSLKIGTYSSVPFAANYSEFPLVFVGALLVILSFSSFLINSKNRFVESNQRYFALLCLVGLILSTGANAPTGQIYMWLYTHVPGFWIFRSPFPDFGGLYAFALSFLLGIFVLKLDIPFATMIKSPLKGMKSVHPNHIKLLKTSIVCTIIALLLVNAYPLLNGDLVKGGNGFPENQVAFPPLSVTIPSFYNDAGGWISQQSGDFNVFLLPYREYLTYSWGYGGSDIVQYYVNKPIITGQPGAPGNAYSYGLIKQIYGSLDSPSLAKILTFINVKFIWFSRDLRVYGSISNSSDIEQIESQIKNQDGIRLVKLFGDIAIYENKYWAPNKIYIPDTFGMASSNENILPLSVTSPSDKIGIFIKDQSIQTLLEDNAIKYSQDYSLKVLDGDSSAFDWMSLLSNETFSAWHYSGWKDVVTTGESETPSTISYSNTSECPPLFDSSSNGTWAAFNSTLVYVRAEDKPIEIAGLTADGSRVLNSNIVVFWQTGCMGMNNTPVQFPIVIPAHERGIIQLANLTSSNVDLALNNPDAKILSQNISLNYRRIDPTRYLVHVNAGQPFFLVLSESYDENWVASINGQPISDQYHFLCNGCANSWYINKTGIFVITLEFWPQKMLYVGFGISVGTLLACSLYIGRDNLKRYFFKKLKPKLRRL